jgi:hypothetical protein
LRMYDMGKLVLAVGGQVAGGANLGDLWATYEVELLQPKLSKESGQQVETDMWTGQGTIDATNPFGTTRIQNTGATMIGVLNNNQYLFNNTLRNGMFLCQHEVDFTPAAIITAPTWTLLNCAFKVWTAPFFASSAVVMFPNSTGTTTRWLCQAVIDLTAGGQASISVTGGFFTGATASMFVATQLPSSMIPKPFGPNQVFSKLDTHQKYSRAKILEIEERVRERFVFELESDTTTSSSECDEDYVSPQEYAEWKTMMQKRKRLDEARKKAQFSKDPLAAEREAVMKALESGLTLSEITRGSINQTNDVVRAKYGESSSK